MFILSSVQTDATLLANNSQHCWMLHVESIWTPCCMLLHVLGVVVQSLKLVKLFRASCKWKQQRTLNIVGPTMLGVVVGVSICS